MSSRPGTSSRGQLGDDDEEDEALIAEELAAYKASRAKALADAELDPVLEAAREGDIETVRACVRACVCVCVCEVEIERRTAIIV